MKHTHNLIPHSNTITLDDVLAAPCLRYWRRLFKKDLSPTNLRQEEIALFGFFKACTPKKCTQRFNVSLSYTYKLIHAMEYLSTKDPAAVGRMLLAHYDTLEEIAKECPEAAAFIAKAMEEDELLRRSEERQRDYDPTVEVDQNLVDRFILTLSLECQSSKENIQVCLMAVLGVSLSTSQIGNIIDKYAEIGREKAKELDIIVLPKIAAIALDEIFRGDTPIFTVVDLDSTYAVLIKPRDDRKAETWEEELKALCNMGLNPETVVSDACGSILVAVPRTFEDAVVMIDVFHVLKDLGDCIRQFIRRVEQPKTDAQDIWKKIKAGVNIQKNTWHILEELEDDIIPYVDRWVEEIETLRGWIIECVAWSGYTCLECKELIEWCLDELLLLADRPMKERKYGSYKATTSKPAHKLAKAIDTFRGHKERTMQYLSIFFQNLESKAAEEGVSPALLESAYRLRRYVPNSASYIKAKQNACQEMRCSWKDMSDAEELVSSVISITPRASSLVENLNSRIRPTLSKKRYSSPKFLELKRLYLNLRPYIRSRKDERKGKSPYELVTGDNSVNFFALLGIAVAEPAVIAA